MESTVKLVCEGVGGYTHKPRTVAQFRYDDGWGRVHNEGKPDPILWGPEGTMTTAHSLDCDRCSYSGYFKPETLYPLLDGARRPGWMPVPR